MKECLKQVLRSKNALESFLDKIRTAVAGDPKATSHIVCIYKEVSRYCLLQYSKFEGCFLCWNIIVAVTTKGMQKIDLLLKEFDVLYDEMSEAKAEGNTTGYTEKLRGCTRPCDALLLFRACALIKHCAAPCAWQLLRLQGECKAHFLKAQRLKLGPTTLCMCCVQSS